MMRVLLIRHAEAEGGHRYIGRRSDPPLSNLGRAQAAALSQRLTQESLSAIYTSPLQRTLQTAHIIAAHHTCSVETIAALAEMDFGLWDGLSFDEIMTQDSERLNRWLTDPTRFPPPDGESLSEFNKRITGAFDKITVRHSKGTIAIITHSGPARVILCKALGLKPESLWSFRMDLAGLSLLETSRLNRHVLILHNDTCHLKTIHP